MELAWKQGWPEAQVMFDAWWARQNSNRPLLLIHAPRKEPLYALDSLQHPLTPEARWLDPEYRTASWERWAVKTYYGGDAFPFYDPQIGPGSLALYLGAVPGFDWGTVWYHKCWDDLATAPLPVYDDTNSMWQAQLRLIEAGERFDGKALTSAPDIIEGIDILSSLAGATQTLLALFDAPAKVHEHLQRIDELYFEYYDHIAAMTTDTDGGTCFSAFQIWGTGRTAKLQCDFSAMISPGMFDEFVAPYLTRQSQRLDNVLYHLDGPDAVCHLDSLLAIPGINAIQWTPGEGHPRLGDECWWPMYARIRSAGKGLALYGVSRDEGKRLTGEFGPEGLLLSIGVDSPEEAERLVEESLSW